MGFEPTKAYRQPIETMLCPLHCRSVHRSDFLVFTVLPHNVVGEGFEPSNRIATITCFPGKPFQPLMHPTIFVERVGVEPTRD